MRIAISGSGLPPDNPLVLEAFFLLFRAILLVGGNSHFFLSMFISIYLGFHDPILTKAHIFQLG